MSNIFNLDRKDNFKSYKKDNKTRYSLGGIPNRHLKTTQFNIKEQGYNKPDFIIDIDNNFYFNETKDGLFFIDVEKKQYISIAGCSYTNTLLYNQPILITFPNQEEIEKITKDTITIGGYRGDNQTRISLINPNNPIISLSLNWSNYGDGDGEIEILNKDNIVIQSNTRIIIKKYNKLFYSGFVKINPEFENNNSKIKKLKLVGGFDKIKDIKIEYPTFNLLKIELKQGDNIFPSDENIIYLNKVNLIKDFDPMVFFNFDFRNFDFTFVSKNSDIFKKALSYTDGTSNILFSEFLNNLKNKKYKINKIENTESQILIYFNFDKKITHKLASNQLKLETLIIEEIEIKLTPFFTQKVYYNNNVLISTTIRQTLIDFINIFLSSNNFNIHYNDNQYQLDRGVKDIENNDTYLSTQINIDGMSLKEFIDFLVILSNYKIQIGINSYNRFFLRNINEKIKNIIKQNKLKSQIEIKKISSDLCNSITITSKNDKQKTGSKKSYSSRNIQSIQKNGLYEKKIELPNIYNESFSKKISNLYLQNFSDTLKEINLKNIKVEKDYDFKNYKFQTDFIQKLNVFTKINLNTNIKDKIQYLNLTLAQKDNVDIIHNSNEVSISTDQHFNSIQSFKMLLTKTKTNTIKFKNKKNVVSLKNKFVFLYIYSKIQNLDIEIIINSYKNKLFNKKLDLKTNLKTSINVVNKWQSIKIPLETNYISNIEMEIKTKQDGYIYIDDVLTLNEINDYITLPLIHKKYFYKNNIEKFDLSFYKKNNSTKDTADKFITMMRNKK